MTFQLLRDELTRRGVQLHLEGDRVKWRAPKGAVADLLPELQRFKPSLLELLARERDAEEVRHLARAVLDARRNNGRGPGFDLGHLRPYWRAANQLTGRNMTSSEVAAWAKEQLK